jgi:exosortase/archaeosortase family protein
LYTNMPESTPAPNAPGSTRFVLTLGAWFVGLFGLMRLDWVEDNLLTPLAQIQQQVADQLTGAHTDLLVFNASCSGGDPMALCAGAILAYPAAWGSRLRGAALGLLAIVLLNVVRIGNLSLVAADKDLFYLLHIYVWPGVLILATACYVFAWMNRQGGAAPAGGAGGIVLGAAARRFLLLSAALVVVYFATAPFFYESAFVDVVARWIAATGGAILAAAGTATTVSGPVIRTAHGGFRVTQECIFTPLIPLYIAGMICAPLTPWRRGLALAVTPAVFFALGVSRLLVLAVPATVIGSYSIAVHAFSQTLVALILVSVAAVYAAGPAAGARAAATRAVLALGVGIAAALAGAPLWGALFANAAGGLQGLLGHAGHAFADDQGAWLLVPAFQLGLFAALWAALAGRRGWPRALLGLGALAVTQAVLTIPVGELAWHYGFDPHAGLIRGWALAAPVGLIWLLRRPSLTPAAVPAPARAVPQAG